MSEEIKVRISDYKISCSPNRLSTLGLGSCVAIFIYDEQLKIGGLSHIMLPDSLMFSHQSNIRLEKFADLAIPDMVNGMKSTHPKCFLKAKIAGGASMFKLKKESVNQNIGERNVKAVQAALKELDIPIVSSHIGGNSGRSVFIDLFTMTVTIKMVNQTYLTL